MDKKVDPILDAIAFAARAHQGHLRKDGKTPYVSHVFRVCLIVRDLFGFDDPRMLMTAVLHDTIEDTTTDFDDIEERFGNEVAEWVALLTKDKSLPEKEREAAYIAKLQAAPWQVQVCKLADMYDNLMDMGALPAERRGHTLGRMQQYFTALKNNEEPKLERPLSLVEQLVRENRNAAS